MTNLQPAQIRTQHWRGTYVARLTPNDRGGFSREFADITKVEPGKPRTRLYANLEPGWYEVREGYKTYRGAPNPPTIYRVDNHSAKAMGTGEEFPVAALRGPIPGAPGEYNSEICECGQELEGFNPEGFPYCADHAPVVATRAEVRQDAPW